MLRRYREPISTTTSPNDGGDRREPIITKQFKLLVSTFVSDHDYAFNRPFRSRLTRYYPLPLPTGDALRLAINPVIRRRGRINARQRINTRLAIPRSFGTNSR